MTKQTLSVKDEHERETTAYWCWSIWLGIARFNGNNALILPPKVDLNSK